MRIFFLATDEAVAVGDDIVVKVLEIDGDQVRLGIECRDEMIPGADGSRKKAEFEPVP